MSEAASYRLSHQAIGHTYDERLTEYPWDGYIDHWQRHHLLGALDRHFPGGIRRHLDFACGTGRLTGATLGRASEIVGVDIADEMLAVARAKLPGVRFVCADLTTEDARLGTFDLVTAWRFFGNSEQSLRESAVCALAEMQPKGGILIANNHRNPNALAHRIGQLRGNVSRKADGTPIDLTHGKFRRLLRRAGYRVVRSIPIGVWAWRAAHQVQPSYRKDYELAPLYQWQALAHVSPDCVVVARKH